MKIIDVENLTYIYDKKSKHEKTALDNISFAIEKEDIVGIVGKNGSGKSTLINVLKGLINPTSRRCIY